jgi:hypothetical protein
MRKHQPDYAKGAEPAALFPDPRLAPGGVGVCGAVHRHGQRGQEGGGKKTCLGAFQLVLEHARQRKRAFLSDILIFQTLPHPVYHRLQQSATRPQAKCEREREQQERPRLQRRSHACPCAAFPVPCSSNAATPASDTHSSG